MNNNKWKIEYSLSIFISILDIYTENKNYSKISYTASSETGSWTSWGYGYDPSVVVGDVEPEIATTNIFI